MNKSLITLVLMQYEILHLYEGDFTHPTQTCEIYSYTHAKFSCIVWTL